MAKENRIESTEDYLVRLKREKHYIECVSEKEPTPYRELSKHVIKAFNERLVEINAEIEKHENA